MQPLSYYIVIDPVVEAMTKTEGGLLLTDKDGEVRYKKGIVMKPGTDVEVLKEGDIIYYDRHAGQILDIGGTDFTIIQLRDVVVVM